MRILYVGLAPPEPWWSAEQRVGTFFQRHGHDVYYIHKNQPIDDGFCKESDVIYCSSIYASDYAVGLKNNYKKPFVLQICDLPPWRLDWPEFKLYRISALKADEIVAISNFTKEAVQKWLDADIPITVNYLGVDQEIFDQAQGVPQQWQIVYAGRLVEHKNVATLIKAMQHFKEKLVIVGDGPQRARLEKLTEGTNTTFLGFQPLPKTAEIIKESMFMVFPSRFEGFGVPPIEANYSGKPCIVKDIPVMREVHHGNLGVVSFGTEEELAERIRLLKDDSYLRDNMGKIGKRFVLQKDYTLEANTTRMEKILEKHI
jgi:glycosyltransferase involved in cell wall biosynthesis